MGTKVKINQKRIWEEFRQLVSIDSVSFKERQMADALTAKLNELGFEAEEDDIGARIGGNAGNIYGFLKGTIPGEPILLSAHMDTVTPGVGKQAVLHEDGKITSAKDTVLGADDVNGIVGILEGIRSVREAGIAHRDIEVVFPVAEEVYSKGSEIMDYSKIKARDAYILDVSGAPGSAAIQAPTILSFTATVHGKAAHAGFCPQKGIHAISIMSEAVSKIKQGYLGDDTTLNIGMIQGGEATNIVPEFCMCRGEVRSYEHERALLCADEVRKIFEEVVEGTGADFEMEVEVNVHAYKTDEKSTVVRRFVDVCESLDVESHITRTFGGSDNNDFALHGIQGIVLSCGMNSVHSVEEYTSLGELELCAKIIAGIITSEI